MSRSAGVSPMIRYTVKWTSKVRATYRYFVYAKDLAGNAQSKVGSAKVVVR